MLVLSRKMLEGITIKCPGGEIIKITVADIDRGKIRLGITAPRNFVILRDELTDGNNADELKKYVK